MAIYQIDPLTDPRWTELVDQHPRASIFHTSGWLQSLQQCYGYRPVAFTTRRPGQQLTNAIVFCSIRSWITGSRLVSLPFSDHCEPLFEQGHELGEVVHEIRHQRTERWDYIEIRPLSMNGTSVLEDSDFRSGNTFHLHTLDLSPTLETLLRTCDKGAVQRKIRRAEREGLAYKEGRSEELLAEFHRLLVLTRRRHRIPPQPMTWFRTLAQNLGEKLTVRVASAGGRAIASIVTLRHRDTMVYKYGCSDLKFSNLGGTPVLFWRMIQDAKREGCHNLDLGRSDNDNPGLIRFKSNWGASDALLRYWRYPPSSVEPESPSRKVAMAGHLISRLPDRLFVALGEAVYRHIG